MKRSVYHGKDEALSVEKKKKYEQKFRDIWLVNPFFKSRIRRVRNPDGDFQPMCAVGNAKLPCANTLIHANSKEFDWIS